MCTNSHTDAAHTPVISARAGKKHPTQTPFKTTAREKAPFKRELRTTMSSMKAPFLMLISLTAMNAIPAAVADTLTVTVNNIEKAGEIHVAVYDNAEAFEADRGEKGGAAPGITEGTIEMVEPGSVTYVYELPPGTYAIGIFHDVNLNNKMDSNLFGIPKEQYGFSNNARAFLGPPAFEAAAFELKGETTQSIDL